MKSIFYIDDVDFISNQHKEEHLWQKDEISFSIFKRFINRRKYNYPDYDLEQEWIRLKSLGDRKAYENLILTHLRLVVYVAKRFQNNGLLLNDLVSEGIIGLIRAAQRVTNRGVRFRIYAFYWIKSAILNSLNKYGNIIKYPQNIKDRKFSIDKFTLKFFQETGREPTYEEISEGLNLTTEEIERAEYLNDNNISIDALIENFGDLYEADYFLNSKIVDSEQFMPVSAILASGIEHFDKRDFFPEEVIGVFGKLYDRERDILKLHYGIGCPSYTLEELGAKFDLTRERVRTIKEKAFKKLRKDKIDCLLPFLNNDDENTTMENYNPMDKFRKKRQPKIQPYKMASRK